MPPSSMAGAPGPVPDGSTDAEVDSAVNVSDAGFDASGLVPLTLTITTYGPAAVSASSHAIRRLVLHSVLLSAGRLLCAGRFGPTERFAVVGDARSLDGRMYDREPVLLGHDERTAIGYLDRERVELRVHHVDVPRRPTSAASRERTTCVSRRRRAANLPGTYRAWLSTDATSALSRLAGARGMDSRGRCARVRRDPRADLLSDRARRVG